MRFYAVSFQTSNLYPNTIQIFFKLKKVFRVNGVFHVRDAVCMSPGSSVSILKSLASLEVPRLLGVSRASSKESKRTCLVPDWSQCCISRQECSIQVSRKLCINFEVSSFLRSTWILPYSKILYSYWLIHGQHWPLIGPNTDGVKDDLPGVGSFLGSVSAFIGV